VECPGLLPLFRDGENDDGWKDHHQRLTSTWCGLINPKVLQARDSPIRRFLEPLAIEDNNLLAGQLDDPALLKEVQGNSYACSSDAEHQRQELMRQWYAITA
jgi:hypothetical protein